MLLHRGAPGFHLLVHSPSRQRQPTILIKVAFTWPSPLGVAGYTEALAVGEEVIPTGPGVLPNDTGRTDCTHAVEAWPPAIPESLESSVEQP
jgi:hypothetical protein